LFDAPLNAALLGRRVAQEGKAATGRSTPKHRTPASNRDCTL